MDREFLGSEAVMARIRAAGHYRIVIEPIGFDPKRVPTLVDLHRLVADCSVRLRGWDYPHVSDRPQENGRGQDFIESWISWARSDEYWRFFQSAQFVHLMTYRENHPEYAEKIRLNLRGMPDADPSVSGFLDITSTIWTMTEIFEFAAGLAIKAPLADGAIIDIQMRNVANRALGFSAWERDVFDLHKATTNAIVLRQPHTHEELVTRSRELAVKATAEFFDRFGATLGADVLADIQGELYRVRS